MTVNEAIRGLKNLFSEHELTLPCTDSLEILHMSINALEKQIPQEVVNQGGTPLSGYCPRCNAELTKPSSPVGCKWCLQRLSWRDEE